jgi:Flp pilus assembly protein CpaB
MLRRSPRTVLVWVAALAVGLVTARVVAGDLAALHRRARALGAPVGVVVASDDLPIGSTVTAGDVTTVSRHESQIPKVALTEVADVLGRTVVVPVLRGATVLPGHLADPERDGTGGVLAPGTRAVRVPLGESLRPEPGDVVDVLGTLEGSMVSSGETSAVVASGATVLEVDASDEDAALGSGLGATVLVTVDDAERVAYALAYGVVTVALAPPEDACCKTSSWASSRD